MSEYAFKAGLEAAGLDSQTAGDVARESEKARKQGGVSDDQAAAAGGAAGAVVVGAGLQAIGIPAPIGAAVGAAIGKELGPIVKDAVNWLFGGDSEREKKRKAARRAAREEYRKKVTEYWQAIVIGPYDDKNNMIWFLVNKKLLPSYTEANKVVTKVLDAQAKLSMTPDGYLLPRHLPEWQVDGKFNFDKMISDPGALQKLELIQQQNVAFSKRMWAAVADTATHIKAVKIAQFMKAMQAMAAAMRKAQAAKTAAERAEAEAEAKAAAAAAQKEAEQIASRERRQRNTLLVLLGAAGVGGYVWYKRRKKAA